jgi:hypothetical protein
VATGLRPPQTTTETSHEPPDKDDNTTFTRHLAGASRQIDTTVPMGRTSAHSSPRRALGPSPKAVVTRVNRPACLLVVPGQRLKQPGANRGRYARPHLRRRSAYGSVKRPDMRDHCSFGGRGSPMILEIASAWRDKSEMTAETCRMRALAVSRLGGASLPSASLPPARLG